MMKNAFFLCSILIFLAASCTFDYGESSDAEKESPDLVMENVEYVRVRSSDPIAKFQAERAERYEKQGVMKLKNFSFEQYGERGTEVNAVGQAGFASVDIESGDVLMNDGVRLEVESEDIILETVQLEWKDEPRLLSSLDEEVTIIQESGTRFTGIGLRVETRSRIWEFTGSSSGLYIFEDDEETEETEDDEKITAGAERESAAPTVREPVQRPEDRDIAPAVREPSVREPVVPRPRPQTEDKGRDEGEADESTLK